MENLDAIFLRLREFDDRIRALEKRVKALEDRSGGACTTTMARPEWDALDVSLVH